jgi:hypothetical protein
MLRSLIVSLLAFVSAVVSTRTAYALGMRVSPGGALIQGVIPGERLELATPLTIMNDDDQPHEVAVSTLRPSQQSMRPPSGYSEIPDASWVSMSQPEVNVPPKGQATVKMVLNIPAGEGYYNQHWSVVVAVRSKPAPGQMIALGLYPRFEIDTAPSVVEPPPGWQFWRSAQPPFGDFILTPSVHTVEGVRPGGKPSSVSLRAWNNTDKTWSGDIRLIVAAEGAKDEGLTLSGGWQWIPEASWVKMREVSLKIAPRRSEALTLEVGVPAGKENYGVKWEAIVLFKGKDGSAAIARLRVRTIPQGVSLSRGK